MSAPDATGDRPLPLAGVRVVEFSHMVMGPSCGLVLGDLGADVVKVEPVGDGDRTRRLPGSGAGFFAMYNRNKRSVAVDLHSAEGLEYARRLVATADVVTENFRPGALDALGLGYDDLREDNPGLVYCSLKGFLSGAYEQRTALDEVVQMLGGLAYMTGPPGRPLRAGASVNDVMGGVFAAVGVLAALHERRGTGRGQLVRSSLFENNVFLVGQHMAQYAVTGRAAAPMPARLSAWAVYDVFDTADGEKLFLGVVTDTQWRAFCAGFGLDDLAADTSLATNTGRVAARDRVLPRIRTTVGALDLDEAARRCAEIGLPFAPIQRPEDLAEDPHLAEPGALVDLTLPDGRGVRLPALPLELAGHRLPVRHDLPGPGEHTAQVAAEIGYTPDEVAAAVAAGTFGSTTGPG
ncbi:CaiB/BaiF CoA transferase family protein [Pseudonocardia sp. HH130630-07]|uniref:CaiB/BaiF CoA transferase family protein n=1 Tax=Pseudonocardia sp. HH130630-07 TaxID=1690815 RepID=UPI000814D191|nr:CaiB/BaiF CoA-transferase family protein [Pseudonocardia sp. HH130630-07]ANY05477.1 CoA-transferase [Pseudonocardia sp. HH130630-07]